MSHRYLTFDQYDGSLGGLLPNPAGPYDVASPGGMATVQHHWTRGMFGVPERTYDVYAGTGDRYPYAEYGNMYVPSSHAAVHALYQGPHTARTEYKTLSGQPYYWEELPPNYSQEQLPQNYSREQLQMTSVQATQIS